MAENTPVSELQHPAVEPASGVEAWLEKNFKKVLLGALLLILAAVLVGGSILRTRAVEHEAAEAFTSAKTPAEMDSVLSQHEGSAAAANALIAKADLLWTENKKDDSIAALQQFVDQHEGHPFFASALISLGSKLESIGENAKAKGSYERVINEYADAPAAPLAELRVADLLWGEGKEDEAKAIYEGLPSKYPGTNQPFFDQSQSRLQWLGANLPTKEVDAPPAPPAPDPTQTGAAPPIQIPGAPGAGPINLGAGTMADGAVTVTPDGSAVTQPIKIEVPAMKEGDDAEAPAEPAEVKLDPKAKEAAEGKGKVEEDAKSKAKAPAKDSKKAAPKAEAKEEAQP